jgi:hypothetical protein
VYLSTRNIIVERSRPIVSIGFSDWRIAELERELEQREEQADTLTRLEGPVCLMPVLCITTLQRKSDLCTPRKENARPQSQYPHPCTLPVNDLYISTISPPIFLQLNRQTD